MSPMRQITCWEGVMVGKADVVEGDVVGILGRKVGMTQVYDELGRVVPVTVVEAGPCDVLQVRTASRDGYEAVQLGYLDKPRRLAGQEFSGCQCPLDITVPIGGSHD